MLEIFFVAVAVGLSALCPFILPLLAVLVNSFGKNIFYFFYAILLDKSCGGVV